MAKKRKMQWYRVDLHLHTPASHDYKDKDAGYIDILRRAEQRGLDIIAFTDHNTIRGYSRMMQEIERLRFLKETGRAVADELRLVAEYDRLLDKIMVLPGFEFTAMFGFHILGIFAPETPTTYIEHVLYSLNVAPDVIERGDSAAGATADVLDCYAMINQAGGMAIAAHINSAHGVMMRGLDFGGQTRIAYTQDKNLHALELTDFSKKGRGSTKKFFDGTKAEYPRRMHLIQGSDAHSLDTTMEGRNTRYGVGERVTVV
ncbi:MAG: PHP domain-containing protein [Aggregatilineales bacterium]